MDDPNKLPPTREPEDLDVRVTAEVRPRPTPAPTNRHERRRYAALSRRSQTR